MKKTIHYYKFRLFLIRFFIIGMMAYIVEVFFTGTIHLVKSIVACLTTQPCAFDLTEATQGHTGIFAFFVYCWAAIPFTFLTNPLKSLIKDKIIIPKLGVILRGVIYGLIFLAIEFIIGMFLLLVFNLRTWDYRSIPLNVFGVITFSYLPAWTLAGVLGEWFHDRLLQIDDILLNPHGYNGKGVKVHYDRYSKQIAQRKIDKLKRQSKKK
jgi:uncharacterized membrane protein